jgi:hypothetical protein
MCTNYQYLLFIPSKIVTKIKIKLILIDRYFSQRFCNIIYNAPLTKSCIIYLYEKFSNSCSKINIFENLILSKYLITKWILQFDIVYFFFS